MAGLANLKNARPNFHSHDIRRMHSVVKPPSISTDTPQHKGDNHVVNYSQLDVDEVTFLDYSALTLSSKLDDLIATSNLTPESDDLRFSAGFGYTSPAAKVQVSAEGGQASMYIINTATGVAAGVSGAVNKFGVVSENLAKAGIDTPNLPFNTEVLSPPPFLKYQDTVLELAGDTALGIPGGFQHNLTNEDAAQGLEDRYRGIAFQVLGDNAYLNPGEQDFDYNNIGIGGMAPPPPNAAAGLGYLPGGTNDAIFTQNQQIRFGAGDNFPFFGFLDTVQNSANIGLNNPITSFRPGGIDFKPIDINIKFQKSQMMKDVSSYLKDNINLGNAFDSLKDAAEGILDTIGENKFIQDIGKGLGGVFDGIGGFGKKLKLPEINLPNINLSGLNGLGQGLGAIGEGIGGALNAAGGVVGDLASYVLPSVGISGNLNPIAGVTLPQVGLQNPFDVQKTNYGGEASFKGRAGLRSVSVSKKPNTPTPIERAINRRPSNATQQPQDDRLFDEGTVSTPYSQLGQVKYSNQTSTNFYPTSMDEKNGGDRMTLAPMLKGATLSAAGYLGKGLNVESAKEGYPLYFKDLRDNTYIILRANIEALTENISPTWSSENYIGRSEPVYIYERAERDLSFTVKMFAQTALELDSIYGKLRRLTSLAYPEYQFDTRFSNVDDNGNIIPTESKRRMKPPLMQFRLGELFGNNNRNQLGFLKSINYSWPDNSPWEFREGQRVPKHIIANLGIQVLHRRVPDKNTSFYGYNASSIV